MGRQSRKSNRGLSHLQTERHLGNPAGDNRTGSRDQVHPQRWTQRHALLGRGRGCTRAGGPAVIASLVLSELPRLLPRGVASMKTKRCLLLAALFLAMIDSGLVHHSHAAAAEPVVPV